MHVQPSSASSIIVVVIVVIIIIREAVLATRAVTTGHRRLVVDLIILIVAAVPRASVRRVRIVGRRGVVDLVRLTRDIAAAGPEDRRRAHVRSSRRSPIVLHRQSRRHRYRRILVRPVRRRVPAVLAVV